MLGQELAAVWNRLSEGINHFDFAQRKVRLAVVVDEFIPALESVSCVADAVFLDGFSPAVNPDMWSPATLAQLGFSVAKLKGLAPKRDRLRAIF